MSKADSLILLLYCNMLMAHHLQQTWQTLVSMQLLSLTIITCTVSVTVCSCCPSPLSHALSVTVALFTLQFTVDGLTGPVGVSVADRVMEENDSGQERK